MANYVGNGYAWWVGQDGNIWANVGGDVQKLSRGSLDYSDDNGSYFNAVGTSNGRPNSVQLYAENKIDDPNVTRGDSASGINQWANYDASSASDSALKNRMIGIYDREIDDLKNSLASLGGQLDNTLAGVKGEYDTYKNEQQSAYDAAKNNYDSSTQQNQQNLRQAKNTIANNSSRALRGLLNVLGSMGAGGGSVAQYEIPRMVADQANDEYDAAGMNYRQNQQDLDTNWGNYLNDHENDRKKLEDWYDSQVKQAKQANYEQGRSLLSNLVATYGNRAQYDGDYGENINEAYDQIADYRNKINDLGAYTPRQYTGTTATYTAPELASYDTGAARLGASASNSSNSASSPLLVALQGLNRRRNNGNY